MMDMVLVFEESLRVSCAQRPMARLFVNMVPMLEEPSISRPEDDPSSNDSKFQETITSTALWRGGPVLSYTI